MRAVTEPYSPPACDERSSSGRNTERRALDTCAIDRRALDAVMADVAAIAAEAESVELSPALATFAPVSPTWSQLLRLEHLLRDWMTANSDCDRAALAELNHCGLTPPAYAPTAPPITVAAIAPSGNNDYVAQLAARLVRRSA